ncbi:putative 2OG-Fe(II) oxygenase [Sphingomonas canadensis]|uniref:2OG-Fe(II) oxygenase n=1 Tax=Sphingomonas canadensis TaxID=1219257 RepID=A0ABW3HB18_9SPHN|nr:putative 2OG-Fe(II) oxygenase [Sphingomonas canadensis]MCW3837137.1 putative 2OG-Fe(II) oxygenase [Sphingomonas canadensis]
MTPGEAEALERRAAAALADGNEEEAAPLLAQAAARAGGNARLWQWSGLLHRALDRHAIALDAFAHAARLAPGDAKIAQGHAHVALEAGVPALALYDRAVALAPGDGEVRFGRAAAQFAEDRAEEAIRDLDALLAQNPGWLPGHAKLAQLRWMMGARDAATASYHRAIAGHPGERALWEGLVQTLMLAEQHGAACDAIARARAAVGGSPFLDLQEAAARSELGEADAAEPLFLRLAGFDDAGVAVRRVRHLLRTGRAAEALPLIERWLDTPHATALWPYAAIAWRLAGDPRHDWLAGDPRLVSVIDLGDRLPPLERLAEVLRGLHHARAQHLDQSVRGGTQTDGPLFRRIEPEIVALRQAIVWAVERHRDQLPPADPRHPTLAPRRDRPVRFAGSWSVRLAAAGHHAAHVHPQGWISSALYVALPGEAERGGGEAGWLTLGAPQAGLGLDLPPLRTVEPRPGRLVLFPSILWHGTVPFAAGERMTVAFDVAPPA